MTGGATDRGPEPFIPVAEVVKAVGLRGEYKLYPLVDWHAELLDTRFLHWRDGTPFQALDYRSDRSCVIVRTEGCGTREAAEALVGREIGFARADYLEPDFPRPAGGLPFRYLGRTVETVAGATIGRVCEVRRYASQVLLLVARADGSEVMVPAVAPILQPGDGLTGPLVIDPPDGLIEGTALLDGP
ncbi:MAG: ribosome maturation factor RimM [Candidatus Krumholzibacteriia bacterium]